MYGNHIKRYLDFIIVLIALICIGWFLVIIAIWLHFANKGAGAIFYQERPGKDERIFQLMKFKSMTEEKDSNGELLPDEERITKVGVFIRKTSIDELPQLINVLKGDMSMVGPRPLLIRYLPAYTEREHLRHSVRPGITGWAQVNGRNTLTWDDKLEHDVYYAEHLSFKLDLTIIFRTVKNMLSGSKDIIILPSTPYLDDYRKQKQQNQ